MHSEDYLYFWQIAALTHNELNESQDKFIFRYVNFISFYKSIIIKIFIYKFDAYTHKKKDISENVKLG